MKSVAGFHIVLGFILVVTLPPCVLAESTSNQAVSELAGSASRPYAVVVDANTLEHPEWGQVVEALKKKYNAKVFVAHYPELGTVRKALNEYMPWYVCFVAQPKQATREMITAAAHTMTWLDDDPYEDAIWAVLTGFVPEDALRIVNAEPLVVRKTLSNSWDGWLDWLEGGVSLSDYKFLKDSDGVKKQLERPKEALPEFVELLNQDDCDIISTDAHGSQHAFYLGYPDAATDGYITHNAKGDIYGVDIQGKVHPVNTKQPKIYYGPGNCLVGHIDRKSCYSLAWIHNGANAFFGNLYTFGRGHNYSTGEYFMVLQGQYTFAEATYANWVMSRFSEDKYLELYPCWDSIDKTTVLYGDPAWEARVKHTTSPAYTQDLNIEHLSNGLTKLTVRITINDNWRVWKARTVRPVVLFPSRIQDAQVKHTDLDKMDVADNFIVLDLDTPSIGGSDLPVGTKKSVVLHARKLEVWPFLSADEVVTRIREQRLNNVSRCFDYLTDETVDPNERIKKAAKWDMPQILAKEADVNATDEDNRTPLHLAIKSANKVFSELLLGKGANINAKDKDGRTPLHLAVESADEDVVELLVSKGADISAKDKDDRAPLHLAVELADEDVVELLVSKGANINAKDKDGRTPLHLAVESADEDVVELLVSKGANINAKDDKSGCTALHHAVRLGKQNVVELLIGKGADINARDKQGYTSLYIAANDDYKTAEFLLSKGADSSIRIESGQSLLELVQQRKQIESTVPDMIFDGDVKSMFGLQIACGDVDGDGNADVLIMAANYDNSRGRVYLFYGGPGMDATADLVFDGQNEGDFFGSSISCGDIDNDGHADILIGASRYNNQEGRVYLYWGSDRKSMDVHPDKIFTGESRGSSRFGLGWPTVYDIDNDGYDDILLGADRAHHSRGRAYLYYGNKKELMDTSPDLTFTGDNPGDRFGYIISCGDVDNDGYGDIVINSVKQQRVYLYYGSNKSNMDVKPDVVFESKTENPDGFGLGIGCVDQNRDGCDDIVIGAPHYSSRQGHAYLFHGNSKRPLSTDPDVVFEGEVGRGSYGGQIVCGDINGDNVDDLVIGARGYKQGVGRVYVYWSNELSGQDHDLKPSRIFTGENSGDSYGSGVACGDVNNDGFDDLVIGAHRKERVYLYYGGPRNK
ncbi:ankyrin repeat domain-containing protein [Planctomycetota bacterium]